jgi:flagellar hook-associated protein 3 FlgL
VSLPEMQDLLNQMDSTIAALQTPGVNVNDPVVHATVAASLDGVDVAMSAVSGRIAGLGGAQNIISTLDDNHGNVSAANKQAMITLGQLDYGEAAIQLSGYSTALQATQKAYSRVSELSLFNVI